MIGHAIRRRGCEMRAPILDQPLTPVADGHVEKFDRDHGNDRPVRTVDIVQGKERVGDRDIGIDEADPIVGERRLRVAADGLRLVTEVASPLRPALAESHPAASRRFHFRRIAMLGVRDSSERKALAKLSPSARTAASS